MAGPNRMVLPLLLLAFAAVASAQISCGFPNTVNATCMCNGILYDFSQLRDNITGSGFFQTYSYSAGFGQYIYTYFQMVNNGLPSYTGVCNSLGFGYAAATANYESSQGQYVCNPQGYVSRQVWTLIPATAFSPQVISVAFSGYGQFNLNVTCDPSTTGFVTSGGFSVGLGYGMNISSCAACPYGCDGPPPPPPGPTCNAQAFFADTHWYNTRGSSSNLAQTPVPAPQRCTLSYRLYAGNGSGVAVSDAANNQYIAGHASVLVASGGQPSAKLATNGLIVSNLVGGSSAVAYVTNTASGPVLTVDASANGGSVITAPLPTSSLVQSGVLLLNAGGPYSFAFNVTMFVGYGAKLFSVNVDGGPQPVVKTVTVDSPIVALASDQFLRVVIFATQQSLVAVNKQSLLTAWLTPQPGIASIALVKAGILVATNSSLILFDYQLGVPIWTQSVACLSPLAVSASCMAACATSAGVTAIDLSSGLTVWVWQQTGVVTDIIFNGLNATLTVASSASARTVQVTVLNARVGLSLWSALVPGGAGRLSVSGQGSLLLLTTFSNPPGPSYLYNFAHDSSGVPCPAMVRTKKKHPLA